MDRTDLAATFGLSSEEVQYELTHLNETKRPSILAAVGSCSALATISILLRVFVRWRNKNEFKADDYSVFIAFVSNRSGNIQELDVDAENRTDPELGLVCCILLPYDSWTILLESLRNADDTPETTYGGLGNHILAVTPKMEHVLSIVRDPKRNQLFQASADFTSIWYAEFLYQYSTLHFDWNVHSAIFLVSLQTMLHSLSRMVQVHPVRDRRPESHLESLMCLGKPLSVQTHQKGLGTIYPRTLHQRTPDVCYSCGCVSRDRYVDCGSPHATYLDPSRKLQLQSGHLRHVHVGRSVIILFYVT